MARVRPDPPRVPERHRPFVVGVTGGLGAGKSALCGFLRDEGLPVLDADQIARAVVAPGSPALAELTQAFGPGLITPAGELDRAALAARALADPAGQARLHAILHPPIRAAMAREVTALGERGARAVVIEAAVLLEGGGREFYDWIVVVVAPEALKVARAEGRGMLAAEARRRLSLQWPDERKAAAAHRVIVNDGTLADLAALAGRLAREIRAEAARQPAR
jgi:dephospho-CoA kinase